MTHLVVGRAVRDSALGALALVFVASSGFLAGCSSGDGEYRPERAAQNEPVRTRVQRAAPPSIPNIPAGTNVSISLLQPISSSSAKPGAPFEAELVAPVLMGGKGFPRGTRVRGHVEEAKDSGRTDRSGYLRITLDAIQTLDGAWVDMTTTSISVRGPGNRARNRFLIRNSGAVVPARKKLQFAVSEEIVMTRR